MTTSAGPTPQPFRSTPGQAPPPLPPPFPWPTHAEPLAAAPLAGRTPRQSRRSSLPEESPGRLVLPNRKSVFVTLHDISRSGCCVIRTGDLDLQPEAEVRIEIWRETIQTKASLAATVRWLSQDGKGRTRVGLHFLDTSIKTQRLIDDYLLRSLSSPLV
jgi:PilZ domain